MTQSVSFADQVTAAVETIRRKWDRTPVAGIILGTGSGGVAEHLDTQFAIDYDELPHFPQSTALGHRGFLHCGQLNGQPVLALQGRFHLYEGYSVEDVTLPVHVMHALGAKVLVATNASGGVNPLLETGHLIVIDDHIDFLGRRGKTVRGHEGDACREACGRAVRCTAHLYDRQLARQALQNARQLNVAAARGVYAAVLGPNYETRAEYRMFRRMGADVVGMSTVPEVNAAAQLGMRSLALSLVTNVARPDAPHRVTGQQVVAAAQAAELPLRQIIAACVAELGSG